MTTEVRQKVKQGELSALVGHLDFLKEMVDIERKVDGKESYYHISQTMEDSISECSNIADRLLYAGLEEGK
jgi:hypothetical protein